MSYLILNLISIIVGVICILIALSWPKRAAKIIFILFVLFSFVAPSCLSLVQNLVITQINQAYSEKLRAMLDLLSTGFRILNSISMILLIAFAISVRDLFTFQVTDPAAIKSNGPSWSTDLDSKQRAQVSTKRNLAFIVDYLPMLLALVCYVYSLTNGLGGRTVSSVQFAATIGFYVLIVLGPLYLVLKDVVGGQSFGKLIFGCRVVSDRTGQPVGGGESALRNLILLAPFAPLVELLVSMIRADKKRLGDLMSETQVVMGPPQFMDGNPVVTNEKTSVHPLDAE